MGEFLNCIIYLFILISFTHQQDTASILCTESICKEYIKKTPCPELSDRCKIQNMTHSGLILPHPSPCNCCEYCVDNLDEDDECILGTADGPVPDMICGDGLFCEKDADGTSKCKSQPTPCMRAQADYQKDKMNGKLGYLQLRPQCDKRGMFLQVKCIPGEICFCVDKAGNRIFGEMPYNIQALDLTKCGCSRIIHKVNELLGEKKYSSLRPKCLSNGNYDGIQCTGKNCVCVNEFSGSPVDPKMRPESIYLASEMACFNNASHPEGTYLNACEKEYNQILDNIEDKKIIGFNGVFGYILPNCQLDGRYAAVQETETEKYCADPTGSKLEEYIIKKTDILSKTMNCYCARSRSIIPWHEKPSCCKNGNYKCMQCRRGKCHCVDKNGLQIKQEVPYEDKDTLLCNNDKYCNNDCTE